MHEIINLFKKGIPRQKKVYQTYVATTDVKNLSYVNFKSNNVALVELKEYLSTLQDFKDLNQLQIENMFEYLRQFLYIDKFSKLKKVYRQFNELSDYLSDKYNTPGQITDLEARENCLDIINKITSVKDTLARKQGFTTMQVEKISLFESSVGQLMNPKDKDFDEEDLIFLLTNINNLMENDRNGKDFNNIFCRQVEKASITRDKEKMSYYKSLYQHLSNIKCIKLDDDYLMKLLGINHSIVDDSIIDRKIRNMKIHPKTRKKIVDDFILSIDNDETKKIDDAFSIEKIEDSYLIGIHIADVYSLGYFEEDSLDVNQKNNVKKKDASLAKNKERNAVSLFVLLDSNGIIRKYKMLNTTLVTDTNLLYNDIPKILTQKEVDPRLKDNIVNLISVYNLLENERFPVGPTVQNLAYVIVSKLMVLCGALYSYEFSKQNSPAIYLVGDKDYNHYSLVDSEFNTGFEGLNCYSRVTSPIIDRLSLINQFFIHRCLFHRMGEEQKYKMIMKLRPVVDRLNKNKDSESII